MSKNTTTLLPSNSTSPAKVLRPVNDAAIPRSGSRGGIRSVPWRDGVSGSPLFLLPCIPCGPVRGPVSGSVTSARPARAPGPPEARARRVLPSIAVRPRPLSGSSRVTLHFCLVLKPVLRSLTLQAVCALAACVPPLWTRLPRPLCHVYVQHLFWDYLPSEAFLTPRDWGAPLCFPKARRCVNHPCCLPRNLTSKTLQSVVPSFTVHQRHREALLEYK